MSTSKQCVYFSCGNDSPKSTGLMVETLITL